MPPAIEAGIRCLELFPDTYAVPARDQWSPFYRSRKLLKFYVPYNWLLYLVVCTHRRVAGNSPPACFAGRVEIRHVIFIKRPLWTFSSLRFSRIFCLMLREIGPDSNLHV